MLHFLRTLTVVLVTPRAAGDRSKQFKGDPMVGAVHRAIWAMAMLCVLLCGRTAPAEASGVVRVKYAEGTVEIDTLASNVKFYANQNFALSKCPDEMEGLQFVRHAHGRSGKVTIDAAPGATVYLIFGAGPKAKGAHNQAVALGWGELGEVKALDGKKSADAMSYKLVVQTPLHAIRHGSGDKRLLACRI